MPIGALTGDHRDNWVDVRIAELPIFYKPFDECAYQAREALLAASPQNKESLTDIESAAILVALDDSKPITREEVAWGVWVGDGRNRFYDKHQCEFFHGVMLAEHASITNFILSYRVR